MGRFHLWYQVGFTVLNPKSNLPWQFFFVLVEKPSSIKQYLIVVRLIKSPKCPKYKVQSRVLFILNQWLHGVSKSQKKSHSTLRAKRATFTFWVDKSWWKNWWKMSNWKHSNETLWVIFKQCGLLELWGQALKSSWIWMDEEFFNWVNCAWGCNGTFSVERKKPSENN